MKRLDGGSSPLKEKHYKEHPEKRLKKVEKLLKKYIKSNKKRHPDRKYEIISRKDKLQLKRVA